MATNNVIRILIADDHDLIRAGIKHMLKDINNMCIVGESADGEEAIRLTRELNPHVVLLDMKMPGISGLEAAKKMLRINPDLKILVVTVCEDSVLPGRFLHAGAAGYLTKGSSKSELIQAIRSVYVGQRYVSSKIAQKLVLNQLGSKEESPFEKLSDRELQVMLMVVQGLKAKEIAAKLHLTSKTINSYRYRLFAKLKINGNVELSRLAERYQLID